MDKAEMIKHVIEILVDSELTFEELCFLFAEYQFNVGIANINDNV